MSDHDRQADSTRVGGSDCQPAQDPAHPGVAKARTSRVYVRDRHGKRVGDASSVDAAIANCDPAIGYRIERARDGAVLFVWDAHVIRPGKIAWGWMLVPSPQRTGT